jgi:hypothetical protein
MRAALSTGREQVLFKDIPLPGSAGPGTEVAGIEGAGYARPTLRRSTRRSRIRRSSQGMSEAERCRRAATVFSTDLSEANR